MSYKELRNKWKIRSDLQFFKNQIRISAKIFQITTAKAVFCDTQ
jgi:hypothetical protein